MTDIIPGLTYVPDFISKKEERSMLKKIAKTAWENLYVRQVQQYGYVYDFRKRTLADPVLYTSLPAWANTITTELLLQQYIGGQPNQLIVNEYKAGRGIAPHIDSQYFFENEIAIVSLASGCIMNFEHANDSSRVYSLYLAVRSLLVMRDDARHEWLHGIANAEKDWHNNKLITRKRRVSLTFRTIKKTCMP